MFASSTGTVPDFEPLLTRVRPLRVTPFRCGPVNGVRKVGEGEDDDEDDDPVRVRDDEVGHPADQRFDDHPNVTTSSVKGLRNSHSPSPGTVGRFTSTCGRKSSTLNGVVKKSTIWSHAYT